MKEINAIGIDIGNGYAFPSAVEAIGRKPIPLIPAETSEMASYASIGIPTVAYVSPPEGTDIRVLTNGVAAEIRYRQSPENLIRTVKAQLQAGKIRVKDVQEPVEVANIYAAIVRDVLIPAQRQLKTMGYQPCYNVVFTFPASFAEQTTLLETMQKAIEGITLDGHPIRVLGRLPEPAAVAIDFLDHMQHRAEESVRITQDSYTVLVYDLGHGTFDAAVVTARSKGEPYQLHGQDGLDVGGKDFDRLMYQEFCRRLKKQGYTPKTARDQEKIRREAVKAKLELSVQEASVRYMDFGAEEDYKVEIRREDFERQSENLVRRTLVVAGQLLEEASEANVPVDAIVLSGGASQMPMVKRLLEEEFPEYQGKIQLYCPSQAVSFGASRYALGMEEDETSNNTVLNQQTQYGYGFALEGQVEFAIRPGQNRPVTSEPMTLTAPSSRMEIRVYRDGEKNQTALKKPVTDCVSMRWFAFDVEKMASYQTTLTVTEGYNLQVTLTDADGNKITQSTADGLEQLL